jgi:hypothetical protein
MTRLPIASVAVLVVATMAMAGSCLAAEAPPAVACPGDRAGGVPAATDVGSIPVGTLLRLIGRCAGIDVTAGDPPEAKRRIGRIDWTSGETALVSAARGYSWIAVYGSDGVRIERFIVLGADVEAETAPPHVQDASADPAVTRAIAIRDVIRLSYTRGPDTIVKLREIAEQADDPAVRGAAFSAIAGMGGPAAKSLLAIRGLHDPDPTVRLAAADGLVRTGAPDALPLIRSASLRERDPRTRASLLDLAKGKPGPDAE